MRHNINQFLNNKKDIQLFLEKSHIKDYIIYDNLTVDVKGDVNLSNQNLKAFPIQFGVVSGSFLCDGNNLTTLLGAPHKVALVFDCSSNALTSLEYAPEAYFLIVLAINSQP
jgi:hypothetical protein